MFQHRSLIGITLSLIALLPLSAMAKDDALSHGRYLIQIAGCNDCHTPGYAESGGAVPEAQWLTGTVLGNRGDWGTTYATNLRLYFTQLSETQWVDTAHRLETRPPMPWPSLRAMSDGDLRAIFRFVQSLGPAGQPAPAYQPPGSPAVPPYLQFPSQN